jgi:Protein of Unknown function (DUF2784)
MLYRAAADAVLLLHLAFVLFVVLGGFLVLRWRKLAWAHLPAVAWGALIEFSGWICPLTPLEIALRHAAGDAAYAGDFVEHYIVALLYPDSLTRDVQVALGIAVVLLNTVIYGAVLRRQYRRQRA